MLRRIRERGPVALVPLAWLVVTGAHLDLVGDDAIFVAHLVMAVFIAGFVVTGWSAMATGALAGWRAVMVVGFGITLTGIVGFLESAEPALAVSLVGWMLLPAAGLAYTARELHAARFRYTGAALSSTLGAGCYLAWLLAGVGDSIALTGFALVGLGQTAGIVDAAVRS
ncbi:hypothetical protein [Halosolutus halophilus]|uniref:hypothetical protein n=1 Tax=Halosolutus halophilus TaxID=1552990 RepID=UPI0022352640|nr:hypothetical protein [Halosolutus halophilus]